MSIKSSGTLAEQTTVHLAGRNPPGLQIGGNDNELPRTSGQCLVKRREDKRRYIGLHDLPRASMLLYSSHKCSTNA